MCELLTPSGIWITVGLESHVGLRMCSRHSGLLALLLLVLLSLLFFGCWLVGGVTGHGCLSVGHLFLHFVVLPASHAVRHDRFRILVALRIIASQLVFFIVLMHALSSSGDAILILIMSYLNLG